ncbi:MAG: type II secretion system minor pseudopilin GspI [Gammaproteobacteria bacterium]|nr:type II secretion system minor pseudopilin GspI [Gammaproteobacteria bacterium]
MTRYSTVFGFTLLEVLVAMAVMAFALAALWKALIQGIAVTDALPDRIVARWVAHNHVVMRQAGAQWPEARDYRGSEEMAGRTWYWEEEVTTTGEPQLRRITVRVGAAPDALTLATMEGFIKQRPAHAVELPGARQQR